MLSRRTVADRKVPLVVLSVPLLCFVLDQYQAQLFGTYRIGLEMLAIKGALTWLGLVAISTPRAAPASAVAP